MAKKLGRCSRCREQLTKPPHKYAGALLCDNCFYGNGPRPREDELTRFKRTLDPNMRKIADEIWKEK